MAGPNPSQHNELHSFVGKFVRLWQSGYNANLSLESKFGEAEVHLKVGLGGVPPPPHRTNLHHRARVPGPSQQRRRQRRAEARESTGQADVIASPNFVSEETNVGSNMEIHEAEEATHVSEEDTGCGKSSLNETTPVIKAAKAIVTDGSPILQLDGDCASEEDFDAVEKDKVGDIKVVDKVIVDLIEKNEIRKDIVKKDIKKKF